jgi:drug/metabolite transporter (DMT)-like permease
LNPTGHGTRLIVLAAIWGGSFLFTRVAGPYFGPVALIFLRVGSAAALLLPLALLGGEISAIRANAGKLLLLGVLNSAVPFTLLAAATLSLGAGMGSILNATAPLWGAALGIVFLGERPSWLRALGLALGFAGVALLVEFRPGAHTPGGNQVGRLAWLPVAAALAATFLYALSAQWSKRRLVGVSPLAVSAGSQLGATLLMLPAAIATWPTGPAPAHAWMAALALGVVCTALAYLIYFRMIAEGGAGRALAVTYLVPVFGVLWGWMLLGEPVTPGMLAASAVVILGTFLSSRTTKTDRAQPPVAKPVAQPEDR